jgi:hypothetical protein
VDVVETWRGIYPVTAFVRDALRSKLGQVERDALLEPEQILLTACEFWFSVNTGGLGDCIRQRKMIPLMRAQQAFTDIGAVRVASVLRVLVAELARDPEPANLEQLIAGAEDALAHTEDRVDELIARFAAERLNLEPAQDDG